VLFSGSASTFWFTQLATWAPEGSVGWSAEMTALSLTCPPSGAFSAPACAMMSARFRVTVPASSGEPGS
jgi:hypothetical protein